MAIWNASRNETVTGSPRSRHLPRLASDAVIGLAQVVEFELLSAGSRLWKSVRCDGSRGRWIVYANLKVGESGEGLQCATRRSFADSAAIIRRVLGERLNARDWIGVVLCGERLSFTIRPD
jgi:hypothetical protein